MKPTRFIGLGLIGILGLTACTSAIEATSDGVSADGATTEVSASPVAKSQPKSQPKNNKVIYLTFDDGPWDIYTTQMLDVLEETDARATFFVVGQMAEQHPKLIKRIIKDGHAIGNHTWSHADLTSLGDAEIRRQLTSTADEVGAGMGPCLRPPYGQKNGRVVRIAKNLGYKPIMWATHVADWDQPPVKTMIAGMKSATKPKLNLLLHDGGGDRPNTVEAVRRMIPKWQADGYTLESLPACRV